MNKESMVPIAEQIGDNVIETLMNSVVELMPGTINSHIETTKISLENIAEITDILSENREVSPDENAIPIKSLKEKILERVNQFEENLYDEVFEYVTQNFSVHKIPKDTSDDQPTENTDTPDDVEEKPPELNSDKPISNNLDVINKISPQKRADIILALQNGYTIEEAAKETHVIPEIVSIIAEQEKLTNS